MKLYDIRNRRLIYLKKPPTNNIYWDNLWLKNTTDLRSIIMKDKPKSLVSKITKMFLNPSDGPILEGGCGLGDKVYLLKKLNYNVVGIDTAKATIKKIKREIPEIKVKYGDVRNVPFPENYFKGYWSLGVIEHFFNGYFEVAKEMYRVLISEGYLFLSFPYMSLFRKFKARFKLYALFNSDFYQNDVVNNFFYQYFFNPTQVIEDLEILGFNLVYISYEDGIKGFKDENFIFKFYINRFLKLLYQTHKPKFIGLIRRFLDKFLSLFSAHMVLLVFQKK